MTLAVWLLMMLMQTLVNTFVNGSRMMPGTEGLVVRPSCSITVAGTQLFSGFGTVTGPSVLADGYWWWPVRMDSGLTGCGRDAFMVPATPVSTTAPAPHPFGMHIVAGGTGALVRVAPDLYAGCAPDGHACLDSDARPPGSKGVVQPDTPFYDTRGWFWVKIRWENGLIGWSSDLSPYIEMVQPPTMNFGVAFFVAGDYKGAPLTEGDCLADGLKIASATLQFTAAPPYIDPATGVSWPQVQGLMKCPWGANTGAGNHVAVITAKNFKPNTTELQTAKSMDFQFVVAQTGTTLSGPPAQPAAPRVIYSMVPVNPTMVVEPTR